MAHPNVSMQALWNGTAPVPAQLGLSFAYWIAFAPDVGAATSTFVLEHAGALGSNPCLPDPATWVAVTVGPKCDDPPGVIAADWTHVIPAADAAAGKICFAQYAVCQAKFLRIRATVGGGGTRVYLLGTELRNT